MVDMLVTSGGEIYSTTGAARYLGLTPRQVRDHLYRIKDLAADGRLGSGLYFRRTTLDAFLSARTQTSVNRL